MADDSRLQRLSRELVLTAVAPSSIPAWAIERMASALEEQELGEGDVLFTAGDSPEFIYFMRDGRMRMTVEGGAPLTFEGRWALGGFNVLTDQSHRRTATALVGFRVQRLPADAWLELLEDSFELARSMLTNAARTLTRLEENLGVEAPRDAAVLPLFPLPERPLNLVERLALMADVSSLRGAGIQTLADLAEMTEEVAFEPGEVVIARSEIAVRAYVLFDGEVEALRSPADVVRRFGPGTLLFGAAALAEPPLGWETRAKTYARGLAFRLEDMIDLMEEHFDMVRSVLASIAMDRERLLDTMAMKSGGLVLK